MPATPDAGETGQTGAVEPAGPGWWPMLVVASGLLGFLAATNKWLDWGASLRLVQANDELDYHAIAAAAPRLPTLSLQLQNQHAQRFVFHYLIGLVGRVLGIDAVYAIATVLAVIGSLGLLMCVFRALRLSNRTAAVCLAVFILNAYSIRYYLIARGEITDLLFDLGVLISLNGLFSRRYRLIIFGTIIAALARQTELPAALAFGIVLYLRPGSGGSSRAMRFGRACAPGLIALVIYLLEVHISRPFSIDATPGVKSFTVLGEIQELPSHAGALGQHALRSVNGLLGSGALLLAGLIALPRRRRWRALPVEFWACLAIAGAIAGQALVLSASYADHNETRLSVLGLGSLVCALAVLLRHLELSGRVIGPRAALALIGVLAAGSFHHLYTVVGTANATQTVVLQVIVALGAGLILGRGLWDPRHPPEDLREP